jgi:hypothetical protein
VMAVINNPGLREIAFKIVSDPDFRTDQQGLRRALRRWFETVTPQQREAAEQAFVIRWLEDVHAEYRREQATRRQALPPAADRELSGAITGHLEAGGGRETVAPVAELMFQSESPDWRKEEQDRAPEPEPSPAGPAVAVTPRRPPSTPAAGPVIVSRLADRPVQQPSRKVAGYRQMFPELAFPMPTPSGPKPLAEFAAGDIDYRIAELGDRRQSLRTANSGDESRNDELARRIVKAQTRISERSQGIRDASAEAKRLEAAQREMAERGIATLGELPEGVLAECGFRRRTA